MQDRQQEFRETGPGNHIILIYEDRLELFRFAVPFIRSGLAKGERCVYVVADSEPPEIVDALSAGGVRVTREINRGALVLLTAREYYGLPPFDALRAIERLRERVAEAQEGGFAGLRVAGEMAWTVRASVPDDALGEYESLLEKMIGPGSLTVACMYRKDRFDAAVLEQLVRTHGKVIADDYIYVSLSALFRNLARTDARRLARSARERAVRKGQFFFRQGDRAKDVYGLTNGMAKLVRTDPDGRSVILRIVAPPEPFGERAIACGDVIRLASAEALEDSRSLAWDGSTLRQMMLTHPSVALNAVRLLEERVETERTRLEDLASPDVKRRLARLLWRLAQSIGRRTRRGVTINVSFSSQDLAELVVASPYTISRILAEWRRVDIIDKQRTRILILDQERLAKIFSTSRRPLRPKLSRL